MTPEGQFATLRDRLVGRPVTDRQLAGNTLSLWVDHVPGDGGRRGWTVWLEPTWNVVGPDRVLAGSMQAQDEEEDSGWQAVAEAADGLVGRAVERLEVEAVTGDLIVGLSGGVSPDVRVRPARDTPLADQGPRGGRVPRRVAERDAPRPSYLTWRWS